MLKLHSINNFIAKFIFNTIEAFKIIFKDIPRGRFYKDNFTEYLRRIIWTTLPIALLTVSASSIIYSIHVAREFSARGLTIYFGGVVALALIREGVPVMGTLAVVTQFCSGITAQIGSMKITEQLDAMKLSRVNPSAYILVPFLLSSIVGFPIVIMICILASLIVNYITTNLLIDISYQLYATSILNAVLVKDILLAMVKSIVFGIVVALTSFNCGILTVGGSRAVGASTRLSVVLNFAAVVILDYIITALWL